MSSPCFNNAHCQSLANTFKCICTIGFTGEFCETEKTQCDTIKCQNEGNCEIMNNEPICECEQGFMGNFCEQKRNFCEDSPCDNGTCIHNANGYFCKCKPGFMGRRCHLRPCDYLPCPSNASCIDLTENNTTRKSYRYGLNVFYYPFFFLLI